MAGDVAPARSRAVESGSSGCCSVPPVRGPRPPAVVPVPVPVPVPVLARRSMRTPIATPVVASTTTTTTSVTRHHAHELHADPAHPVLHTHVGAACAVSRCTWPFAPQAGSHHAPLLHTPSRHVVHAEAPSPLLALPAGHGVQASPGTPL